MLNLLLPPPLALGTKAMEAALRLGPSATEGQFQARRRRQRLPLPLLASRLAPWPPSSAHRPATLRMHLPLPSRLRCTVGARPDAQGGRALAPPVPASLRKCAAMSEHGRQELRTNEYHLDDDEPLWLAVVRDLAVGFKGLVAFLAEQPRQLKHLEWPGFQHTMKTATLTLVLVAVFIVALSTIDAALCYMLVWLLRKSA